MQRFSVLHGVAVLTLLGGAVTAAQGGPLWSYQWQPTTPYIHSDPIFYPLQQGPGPVGPPIWHWPPPAAGQAALLLTAPAPGSALGSLNQMTAARVTPLSWAPEVFPGRFNQAVWGLRLNIWDNFLHRSGTLLFTGVFDGTLSRDQVGLTTSLTSSATQTLLLGGPFIFDSFTVTLKPFVPPGPPDKNQPGWFTASVDFHRLAAEPVNDGAKPGCMVPTPEPSTLVLAGLGMSALGLGSRRRKKDEDRRG